MRWPGDVSSRDPKGGGPTQNTKWSLSTSEHKQRKKKRRTIKIEHLEWHGNQRTGKPPTSIPGEKHLWHFIEGKGAKKMAKNGGGPGQMQKRNLWCKKKKRNTA